MYVIYILSPSSRDINNFDINATGYVGGRHTGCGADKDSLLIIVGIGIIV